MHENRGVEPLDVVALSDHRAPPSVLQIALELDAERAVIPDGSGAAVDLRGLKHEAAPLAERHELFHHVRIFCCGHSAKYSGTSVAPLSNCEHSLRRQRDESHKVGVAHKNGDGVDVEAATSVCAVTLHRFGDVF